jgi:hypothetical protein
MPWTVIYPGGIAEYFLPNLRPPPTVYAWGDRRMRFPIHTLRDIGAISARAVTDPRTVGSAVQMYACLVTTDEMIDTLERNWPQVPYELRTLSSEELEHLHRHGNADPGGERLSEREIMGISYANYVLGLLGAPEHPGTLSASVLYPKYTYQDPLALLADPAFVFGPDGPPPAAAGDSPAERRHRECRRGFRPRLRPVSTPAQGCRLTSAWTPLKARSVAWTMRPPTSVRSERSCGIASSSTPK